MKPKPWEREPHYRIFYTEGLLCYTIRHPEFKHWCGYVVSPKPLPVKSGDWQYPDVDVHGGCTYYEQDDELGGWVVGFDCAHAGDLSPGLTMSMPEDKYRDMEFVMGECRHLAHQIKELV